MSKRTGRVAHFARDTGAAHASPLGGLVASIERKRPTFHGIAARASTNKATRINLRAVSEVLAANGLDPAVELVKIVKEAKLPVELHARLLNELLQYTQPKLKSVEVRAKVVATGFNVDDAQAKRIAEEFLRSSMSAVAADAAQDDPAMTIEAAL